MSVDLRKGSKRTPIDLKKEESHRKISLAKEATSSGAAAGRSGSVAPAVEKTAKKSGRKKWIAILAALLLVIGAVATIKSVLTTGDITADGIVSGGIEPGASADASDGPAGAADDEMTDVDRSEAAAPSAGLDTAADGTAVPDGGESEVLVSDTAGDALTESPGGETGAVVAVNREIGTYEVIVSDLSWTEAFDDCLQRGGRLCTIDSAEENDAVISALQEANFRGTVYLGGMRSADSKEYHWVDEKKQMQDEVINGGSYQDFWLGGEPSYTDGSGREERYMTILYRGKNSGWVWNDVCEDVVELLPSHYSGKVAYVCEYH